MTNHWVDIKNSDCVLIMGSNAAENHPISMKWVLKAKDNGATIISVDPRFTRTSALADFYTALRSGTDIAFLGGMINYILEKNKFFKDYVDNYTNASYIVQSKYGFKDGLFTGYDPKTRKYDASMWAFEKDANGVPVKDPTMSNPRCVLQLLKKHYSRYTPEKVSSITGTPVPDLLKVYELYSSTGNPDKAGTVLYALGWTHPTVGTHNIRMSSINQLLLGNIGIAGGGIDALRGQPNVQGSTDGCLLFHLIPGYLKVPRSSQQSLEKYLKESTPKTGESQSANWWQNYPKYTVSLLKSFYGENASKDNDFGYAWLPKPEDGKTYSWLDIFDEMYNGKIKGMLLFSQNPAGSSPNTNKVVGGLSKLDWLVHTNIFNNESASFWHGPGLDPKKIKTEVFLLPAACSVEKEGSLSNSGRLAQWRQKAANPPGDAISDGEMVNRLVVKLKELYKKDGGKNPESILNLKWDYQDEKGHFDPVKVAKENNGYFLKDVTLKDPTGKDLNFKKGDSVPSFAFLQLDGSTSSGNWLYCASFTNAGNMMARRGKEDPTGLGLFPNWSWCWPVNRRVLYNRASCDPSGKPWNPKRPLLKWDEGKWVGDVPDGPWPPMSDKQKGKFPFIMKPDGLAYLFGPGMVDGPLPEHYEPLETPLAKNIMSDQLNNPAIKIFKSDMDKVASHDPKFPIVCSTNTVTEHWCSGSMTRWQPWLLEAQPELFVEISPQLAQEMGIKNGERVKVSSIRGNVECVAMVTPRIRPFKIGGQTVHQVAMPFCFGWLIPKSDKNYATNLLTPSVGDANTMCPEYKGFMVNVKKV
jgi:formate dehydrogenase major subunit